jgi:hypothetical protein
MLPFGRRILEKAVTALYAKKSLPRGRAFLYDKSDFGYEEASTTIGEVDRLRARSRQLLAKISVLQHRIKRPSLSIVLKRLKMVQRA